MSGDDLDIVIVKEVHLANPQIIQHAHNVPVSRGEVLC